MNAESELRVHFCTFGLSEFLVGKSKSKVWLANFDWHTLAGKLRLADSGWQTLAVKSKANFRLGKFLADYYHTRKISQKKIRNLVKSSNSLNKRRDLVLWIDAINKILTEHRSKSKLCSTNHLCEYLTSSSFGCVLPEREHAKYMYEPPQELAYWSSG